MIFRILSLLWPCSGAIAQSQLLNNRTTPALNITAIDGINGSSVLQCWQLTPFQISSTPGIQGALSATLANTTRVDYTVIQGRTSAGLHNAPVPQLVYFASGLIRLSIPNTSEEAWVVGGKYGLIFAQDTADKSKYGHQTEYEGDADIIALAMPLASGQELKHHVLHSGGCTWAEMTGL